MGCEGEPQGKATHVPWQVAFQPMPDFLGSPTSPASLRPLAAGGVDATERAAAEGVTTLAVLNLPAFVTQQQFLDEVNRSGFTGVYDFAYLPFARNESVSGGYAFVNFKSKEVATAFDALWRGSRRFGVGPTGQGVNVVPAVVQGFEANTEKWTPAQVAKVKNPAFLPYIYRPEVSNAKAGAQDSMRHDATLVVRNLPQHTTQQEFLDEVNRSGFAFTYDFAYLPRDRSESLGCSYAFVNFKAKEVAAAFVAAWRGSRRFGVAATAQKLNVVQATVQGFRANSDKWTNAHVAKVKNPTFLPFICRESAPKAELGAQDSTNDDTIYAVRNLPLHTTRQEFLDEVDRSGFAGTYGLVNVSVDRRSSFGGYAVLHFKTKEAAKYFVAAWRGSRRFGVSPKAPALHVAQASTEGLLTDTQWSPAEVARAESPAFLPLPSLEVAVGGDAGLQGLWTDVASFAHSSPHATHELLDAVSHSGFHSPYGFPHLPWNRDITFDGGYAKVDFRTEEATAGFSTAWEGMPSYSASSNGKASSAIPPSFVLLSSFAV